MAKRIAISGSAGIGKSTLARRLAADLDLPYLGEGMREYLERTGEDLHRIGRDGLRELVLQFWEERKIAESAATAGFVADRASYDFAAFWLYYQFGSDDSRTEAFLAEALAPGRYDRVYLLPWGVIPLVDDGVRWANRWTQLHMQLLIEGVVRRHSPAAVDITEVGLEDRVIRIRADIG